MKLGINYRWFIEFIPDCKKSPSNIIKWKYVFTTKINRFWLINSNYVRISFINKIEIFNFLGPRTKEIEIRVIEEWKRCISGPNFSDFGITNVSPYHSSTQPWIETTEGATVLITCMLLLLLLTASAVAGCCYYRWRKNRWYYSVCVLYVIFWDGI